MDESLQFVARRLRVSPWPNCAGSSGFRAKPATKSSIGTSNAGFAAHGPKIIGRP